MQRMDSNSLKEKSNAHSTYSQFGAFRSPLGPGLRLPCISQLCDLRHLPHGLHTIPSAPRPVPRPSLEYILASNKRRRKGYQPDAAVLRTNIVPNNSVPYSLRGLVPRPTFSTVSQMASGRPRLALGVQNLPGISEADAAATTSPARGREMRQNLLQKLRAPPLVHNWEFSHDRQDRAKRGGSEGVQLTDAERKEEADSYADRLVLLAEIGDVKEFWSVFNNFDVNTLPQKDSIHLFKKGVKPVWEDERNARGGAWTFRAPKEKASEVWKSICLLAVGEQLQDAVATKRDSFNDDICGVSYSVRFGAVLITIWNRDGDNDEGKENVKDLILENISPVWTPLASQVYYKKHSEHSGFVAPAASASATDDAPKV